MRLNAGILLTATGADANGSLFPLADAVVDAENDVNWFWFLEQPSKRSSSNISVCVNAIETQSDSLESV